MEPEDAAAETDLFLERSGPPSLDFPYHRDNYYMLEAYLPNRGWDAEVGEWRYMSALQHDRDVEFVKAWMKRVQSKNESGKGSQPGKGKEDGIGSSAEMEAGEALREEELPTAA